MNDQELEQAQSAVKGILDALDVARVVYVDDANDESVSVEGVIAAAQGLDAPLLLATIPEFGDSVPDDQDVLATKIRRVWEQIDPAEQARRGQEVVVAARRHGGIETDDVADISILSQLIPEDKLVSLSPAQWEGEKDQLLQDSKDQRALFLFDRDFSDVGGDSEGGIKIIASLLASNGTENLICGLLTHTVTPEAQPQQWADLSNAHGIPRDRFVVIPKLHLSRSPILFAQALKFVALSPDFTELKRKTKEIIAAAATVAADRVEKVSIYDLDHIVFQVSAYEGLWEPDMLFRLHAMFHRQESRRLAHDGRELEKIAEKLRSVSGIPTDGDLLPTPGSAWALQREELYEFEDHINKNHLPLELGDIFERVGSDSKKKYILLAQPCDLMVRNKGERQPEILRVPLVEIVPKDADQQYSEELPYFDESHNKKWFVKFKLVHFVCATMLDLCVFNQDGVTKLTFDGNVPSGIRPSWKKRHAILSRYWGKKVNKASKLVNACHSRDQIKKKVASDLEDLLFIDDLFKGNLSEVNGVQSLTYNCKRIGRLSRARANGLLMSYTATLGRPAYDRDFGKV
ncbi:MAG: hypothetical protein V1806_07475 [Pseudomonadota bacterium]